MWDACEMGWGWFAPVHWFWWLLLVVGAAALLRMVLQQAVGRPKDDGASSIVRQRFARGEIDEQEFDARTLKLKS